MSGTNLLKTLAYGNGDSVQYTYDDVGRLTRESYTDENKASTGTVDYAYDNDGGLATVTDSATGIKTTYFYDFVDRLESYNQKIGDNTILKLEYGYDLENRLTSETWYFPGSNAYVNSYTYNDDGTVQGMGSGVMGTGYSYDGLGRLTRIDSEIDKSVREYTYRNLGNGKTTSQVTKLNYPHLLGGYTFEYTYDVNGNIDSYATGYTDNNGNRITDSTEYTYDAQNQLVRAEGSQIYTYTYNSGGNLVTAFDGTKTHTYSYYAGYWGDLLQYYDGQEIIYDKMGNPTSYYNGTRWTFTWQNGRELTTASKAGTNVSYTYDADGMRKTKTVNGVPHTYYYNGGTLLREVYGDTILDFFYNANGTPIAMRQSAVGSTNYTIYYYITNLQGDVIRLVDVHGNTAAYYRYDPYGKVIEASGSHANINPLRYRGYYYDSDTGLYYLQSRYYDPQICRFINADALVSTGQGLLGNNMFAYCLNNPIRYADDGGHAVYDCFDESDDKNNPFDDVGSQGGFGVHSYYFSGVTQYSNGGSGTGSMIGDMAYQQTKATNTTHVPQYSWGDLLGLLTGNTSSQCFVAGTLIQTADGTKPIEDIQVGDYVWAWDEETGDVELKEVTETYMNETSELVHVFANGEEIVTTPAHPFYSPIKGWTDAVHLRVGDILVLVNGEYVVVEKVQHEILEAPVTVYNFQVEDYHTYYVTNVGVLVHNACQKGVGGKGWEGDKTWRENVNTVSNGGDIYELNGGVPTGNQARTLISQAGGIIGAYHPGHDPGGVSTHLFNHIHYYTASGKRSAIHVISEF